MATIAAPIARFAIRSLVTYAYVRIGLDLVELSVRSGRTLKSRFSR